MNSRHPDPPRPFFRLNHVSGASVARALTMLTLLVTAWLWLTFFLWQPPDARWPESSASTQNNLAMVSDMTQDFSLFGSSEKTPSHAQAPVSNLELRLTGTMAGEDPKAGLAFIDDKKGKQKSFRPGDNVFGLAQLIAVYPDYVLLYHKGREEKIPLATPGRFTTKNKNSTRHSRPTPASLPGIRNKPTASVKEQAQVDAIRKKFQIDPEEIARHIQVVPVVEGTGGLSGLRVSALSQGDLLQKVGLRSNDLIMAVNGVSISPTNMLQLTQQLDSANRVDLTIRRNGRTQTISVDLGALAQR